MKDLSRLASLISPSTTISMDARYKDMLAQGKPVLSLGAGEPDLPMPKVGQSAIERALEEGKTRYSFMTGLPELKSALSQKFKTENGFICAPENILITSGAKQALFSTMMAVLNPGDEVLIPSPYWVTYPEAVKLLGGKPITVPTTLENGFKIQIEDLIRATTKQTKLLILNSPCNPTGVAYTLHEIEALCRFVIEKDLYLISDEIYEHLTFDGFVCTSPASIPGMLERTATVNGFSKIFSMQGLRLGYVSAPNNWAKTITAIQSHASHHPSTLSQYAGLACLTVAPEIYTQAKLHYQKAMEVAVTRLGRIPNTSFLNPQGAFYVFLNVGKLLPAQIEKRSLNGSLELSEYLLEEWNLATVPGVGFGCEGFLRLSFANSLTNLEMALNRLEMVLVGIQSSN